MTVKQTLIIVRNLLEYLSHDAYGSYTQPRPAPAFL